MHVVNITPSCMCCGEVIFQFIHDLRAHNIITFEAGALFVSSVTRVEVWSTSCNLTCPSVQHIQWATCSVNYDIDLLFVSH